MKVEYASKIVTLDRLGELGEQWRSQGRSVVHCHGCFDIVHPGHVRYLQAAGDHGDVLVVSLTSDDGVEKADGTRPHVPQELRAENLAALAFVDCVVIADGPTAEPVLRALRPDLYVKGKEYENSTHPGFLAEKALVEAHGGRVLLSSGDVVYSSTRIVNDLGQLISSEHFDENTRLATCCQRWDITPASLLQLLRGGFAGKRVAVVGDVVCDRYVFCEASDVAAEAPILSVRPAHEQSYFGAAGIIAGHLSALGAQVHLLTCIGEDEASEQLLGSLAKNRIDVTPLRTHKALPLKLRYLVEQQKLLKVDQAEPRPLDSAEQKQLLASLAALKHELDAVIFVDFGYGTLSSAVLREALPMLRPHVGVLAGDISGLHRTLLDYVDVDLLKPTERELRGVMGDFEQSLPTVAAMLMGRQRIANMVVTMGPKGAVMFRPRESDKAQWFQSRLRSDYIPSLAGRVEDVVGAGDAMLATTTLAMAAGATLPQAVYLGSAASAIAISRVGNLRVSRDDLLQWLCFRPELAGSAPLAQLNRSVDSAGSRTATAG
jgi:rfaE bifunctional protein kinase chain/domain/rfaE bifunctional protein nucleotidyltransferase chain/domain